MLIFGVVDPSVCLFGLFLFDSGSVFRVLLFECGECSKCEDIFVSIVQNWVEVFSSCCAAKIVLGEAM